LIADLEEIQWGMTPSKSRKNALSLVDISLFRTEMTRHAHIHHNEIFACCLDILASSC